MSNTQIRIKIAEKEYTLKTTPEEEGTLKQAGRQLNEKIKELQKRTGIWDKQDLLVMVAFDTMVQHLKQSNESIEQAHQVDRLSMAVEQILKGD